MSSKYPQALTPESIIKAYEYHNNNLDIPFITIKQVAKQKDALTAYFPIKVLQVNDKGVCSYVDLCIEFSNLTICGNANNPNLPNHKNKVSAVVKLEEGSLFSKAINIIDEALIEVIKSSQFFIKTPKQIYTYLQKETKEGDQISIPIFRMRIKYNDATLLPTSLPEDPIYDLRTISKKNGSLSNAKPFPNQEVMVSNINNILKQGTKIRGSCKINQLIDAVSGYVAAAIVFNLSVNPSHSGNITVNESELIAMGISLDEDAENDDIDENGLNTALFNTIMTAPV
jgi:hypothetical protein